MKKIIIGATEIEVQSLAPFVYDSGRGEKVLRITVDENTASFDGLKAALDGSEEPIRYFEGDAMKCEYSGYNKFTAQYVDGKYKVELHMASMETQVMLLMAFNERISRENADLRAQVENINVSGEATEIVNAMLGLEG